jgi:hypothetical protein
VTGANCAGGGACAAFDAAGGAFGVAVFSAVTTGGCSGSTGVSAITAGTGSMATRGGGSGISRGTLTDERAGLDTHAPARRAVPNTIALLVAINTLSALALLIITLEAAAA